MKNLEPQDLKTFREERGLSAREFAEIIFTPYTTYMKWERGDRRVPGIMNFVHKHIKVKKNA